MNASPLKVLSSMATRELLSELAILCESAISRNR